MSSIPHTTSPVVISAPSGAGKTTIAKALVEQGEDIVFSVSATTRPARDNEVEGVDYHFLSEPDFRAMIEADEFVECAKVHGHLYGTSRKALRDAWTQLGILYGQDSVTADEMQNAFASGAQCTGSFSRSCW